MRQYNTRLIGGIRANDGKMGGPFEGYSLKLSHHVGAKSGVERVTPVSCFPQSADRFAIAMAASSGRAPMTPDWYHDLTAHQEIRVEFDTGTFRVQTRPIAGAEGERMWAVLVSTDPCVGETQSKTTRTIPVLLHRIT